MSEAAQTIVTTWAEKRPPVRHWVMASYTVIGPLRLFKTCRRGCCVDEGTGPQVLPTYWRDATPVEIDAGRGAWRPFTPEEIANLQEQSP